ncbi:MAG: YiiD C-terminal domain-containing protein [Bdellovibrionaceae bacterium]|nr:YiiD C-terminal domain-containing protein [Pseudobdellovibrionaceae bacterium]
MNNKQMLDCIHNKIPLTHHMGLEVLDCGISKLAIKADFEKNRNHKMTAFGGSVATVLTLACWSWLTNYLEEQGIDGVEISIHKCQIEYNQPILQDFIGICIGTDKGRDKNFAHFMKVLSKKSKGRISLKAHVENEKGQAICLFQGDFVAYKANS